MSIPTFNDTALVSRAGRDLPGSPHIRMRAETLPGVNGQFVQLHGTAGREIIVRGVLKAPGDSPTLAHQALKEDLRSKQTLADGITLATYVGTDGAQYTHCVLVSYEPVGDVQMSSGQSDFEALLLVEVRLLDLTP